MASTTLAQVTTTLVASVTENAADTQNFEAATTVAQIFSGIVFAGLGIWMLVSNGTKLSYIQRASLEKRLATCSAIDTYVALFSAFFNFFQLTEVDDLIIPRASSFVLDFSRPVEWIVTCPMMQVVLVIMGGSRIPEYRRVLMPTLSLAVLVCGTLSMLTGDPIRFIFYGIGLCIATVMFTLNGKQIMEHSNGEENMWSGDSEFRKASVLLIVTWVPFPLWFFLSPEGIGLIDDILVIQMGWAFLNILSKFTFIFYIQRVKDNYCNRLKVKRELTGSGSGAVNPNEGMEQLAGMLGIAPSANNPLAAKAASKEKELGAVVIETMNFLGMAQHNDRFLNLLREAGVKTVPMVEALSKEESDKLQLPWDLVSALQKRIKVWKMEMTDNAEQELERGELHYAGNTPVAIDGVLPGQITPGPGDELRGSIARALMAGGGGGGFSAAPEDVQEMRNQLMQVGDMMSMLQQQIENMNQANMRMHAEMEGSLCWKMEQMLERTLQQQQQESNAQLAERSEAAVEALGRNMLSKLESLQASSARQQAESESQLLQRFGQIVQKASESTSDALSNAVGAKLDMSQVSQLRQQSELEDSLVQRLEQVVDKAQERSKQGLDKIHAEQMRKQAEAESTLMGMLEALAMSKPSAEQSEGFQKSITSRMSDLQATQLRQAEDNIRRKVEEVVHEGTSRVEQSVRSMHKMMEQDLGMVARGTDVLAETVRTTADTQKEGVADLRRMSMMVLEQSSATLDKAQGSMRQMDLLQGSLDSGMGRVLDRLAEMDGGAPPGTPRGGPSAGGNQWPTQGDRRPSNPSMSGDSSRRPSVASKYGMQVING